MKKFHLISLIILLSNGIFAQYEGNTSPTYPELIEIYQKLAAENNEIELYEMGDSDYGLPIYLCIINGAQDSLKTMNKARASTTLLINNAIHPGEPDGVNACLIWIQNWIQEGENLKNLPVIAIIPAYNVGGMMNRSSSSRANQDGPEEYGFRGNSQNLDLNRDFIKMDSKNMFTFAKIYHAIDPDVFIDTHVSNGADYQYTLTYIAGIRERMSPDLGTLMYDELIPELKNYTSTLSYDMIPYVNLKGKTPEEGIEEFNDLPRYAFGYASLMNAMSFTIETHMLKPFPERVKATQAFIAGTVLWMSKNSSEIGAARQKALEWEEQLNHYNYNYQLSEKKDSILFKGFEFTNPISELTGLSRLKYHQDRPYEKMIPYFNDYVSQDSAFIPDYYIIGGQCTSVIEHLKANNVEMSVLKDGEQRQLGQYRIVNYKSGNQPYEGHFLHSKIEQEVNLIVKQFKEGDVIISTHQKNRRFILSVLEPATPDSYFAWNFFDSYVQQKEYFSSYVFEDKALEILKANPSINAEFEKKKAEDKEFANSAGAQLYFIYVRSEFYEPTHNYIPLYSGMIND